MAQSEETKFGTIAGVVTDAGGQYGPITGAEITAQKITAQKKESWGTSRESWGTSPHEDG